MGVEINIGGSELEAVGGLLKKIFEAAGDYPHMDVVIKIKVEGKKVEKGAKDESLAEEVSRLVGDVEQEKNINFKKDTVSDE